MCTFHWELFIHDWFLNPSSKTPRSSCWKKNTLLYIGTTYLVCREGRWKGYDCVHTRIYNVHNAMIMLKLVAGETLQLWAPKTLALTMALDLDK